MLSTYKSGLSVGLSSSMGSGQTEQSAVGRAFDSLEIEWKARTDKKVRERLHRLRMERKKKKSRDSKTVRFQETTFSTSSLSPKIPNIGKRAPPIRPLSSFAKYRTTAHDEEQSRRKSVIARNLLPGRRAVSSMGHYTLSRPKSRSETLYTGVHMTDLRALNLPEISESASDLWRSNVPPVVEAAPKTKEKVVLGDEELIEKWEEEDKKRKEADDRKREFEDMNAFLNVDPTKLSGAAVIHEFLPNSELKISRDTYLQDASAEEDIPEDADDQVVETLPEDMEKRFEQTQKVLEDGKVQTDTQGIKQSHENLPEAKEEEEKPQTGHQEAASLFALARTRLNALHGLVANIEREDLKGKTYSNVLRSSLSTLAQNMKEGQRLKNELLRHIDEESWKIDEEMEVARKYLNAGLDSDVATYEKTMHELEVTADAQQKSTEYEEFFRFRCNVQRQRKELERESAELESERKRTGMLLQKHKNARDKFSEELRDERVVVEGELEVWKRAFTDLVSGLRAWGLSMDHIKRIPNIPDGDMDDSEESEQLGFLSSTLQVQRRGRVYSATTRQFEGLGDSTEVRTFEEEVNRLANSSRSDTGLTLPDSPKGGRSSRRKKLPRRTGRGATSSRKPFQRTPRKAHGNADASESRKEGGHTGTLVVPPIQSFSEVDDDESSSSSRIQSGQRFEVSGADSSSATPLITLEKSSARSSRKKKPRSRSGSTHGK